MVGLKLLTNCIIHKIHSIGVTLHFEITYMEGKNNQKVVIECINILLKKYPNEYLEKSILLTGEQYEIMA